MNRLEQQLARVSERANRVIAQRWGARFPFYYVAEFPRSGGTWFTHLLAHALEVPFPKNSRMPHAMECVLHLHWPYSPRYNRPFYVVRDGRDVAASAWFYFKRSLVLNPNSVGSDAIRARHPELVDIPTTPTEAPEAFDRFVRTWLERPLFVRASWPDHVAQWTRDRGNVHVVRYEDLLADATETLRQAIGHVREKPVTDWIIETAVAHYDFERQTNRKPGEAAPLEAKRSGTSGDWTNHFPDETSAHFHAVCGETLRSLGYEVA
jgi:hypothetical protein